MLLFFFVEKLLRHRTDRFTAFTTPTGAAVPSWPRSTSWAMPSTTLLTVS
jgi:hypothetical protein